MYFNHALCLSVVAEVPRDRLNVTEDMSTEVPSSLLNRSYDTAAAGAARAGRRPRSAGAAARRARLRSATSTSSVPAPDPTHDDRTATVPNSADRGQSNASSDTSGSLGRRPRRRRRTESEPPEKENKETSVTAESVQTTLVDNVQTMNGSFTTASADSNLIDTGSPKNAEEVKTKKRTRKKPRGSSEALFSDQNSAPTADQEFEPDLSISKDFSQSFEMRTSSPVEKMSKPQTVSNTTEKQVSEMEPDSNLWMMCDTKLDKLCKRLLADQNFDKLSSASSGYNEEADVKPGKMKRLPFADDAHEMKPMEVNVEHQVQPTANISKPETAIKLPLNLNVKSQENQVDIVVLPLSPSLTTSPTTRERPAHQKPRKHKKKVEAEQAEQQTETYENETRIGEDTSPFLRSEDSANNRNVPNILSLRETETEDYQRTKHKNQIEVVSPVQQPEAHNVESGFGEDSAQFSTEPDITLNKNVPNVLTLKETETYNSKPLKHKKQIEEVPAEQLELDTIQNRNIPNILSLKDSSSKPLENVKQIDDEPVEQLEPHVTQNRNVPNISSFEVSSPGSRETLELEQVEGRGMPDVIPSSPVPESAVEAPGEEMRVSDGDADDVTAAEELERLEREQRQLIEEEELRQEQEERERREKEERAARREQEIREQQEKEQQETERGEKKRKEKEEKEQRLSLIHI